MTGEQRAATVEALDELIALGMTPLDAGTELATRVYVVTTEQGGDHRQSTDAAFAVLDVAADYCVTTLACDGVL